MVPQFRFKKAQKTFLTATVAGLIAVGCTPTDTNTPPTGMDGTSSNPSDEANVPATKYESGLYVATGNYISPAGPEEMEIHITLDGDVITNAQFMGKATHPTSMKMQGMFKDGFSAEVVGKPIDEISLTVVNGSSLAPKGFMDALTKVKTEAQA